jgi:gamma-tubulin complex component 2
MSFSARDRDGVNGATGSERASRGPRMPPTAHDSFKSDRPDSKRTSRASPQPSNVSAAHKRTISGNPRPASRVAEEKRTERTQVTTRETLTSRTRSPDGKSGSALGERQRAGADGTSRPRAAEARPKDPKVEAPPPGKFGGHGPH